MELFKQTEEYRQVPLQLTKLPFEVIVIKLENNCNLLRVQCIRFYLHFDITPFSVLVILPTKL